MKAIIETGGKQYLVKENDVIYVELLKGDVGDKVVFDRVLMLDNTVGKPYVKAKVTGEIEKNGKQKKIVIFKYRPKKKSRTKQGHRQPYTRVKITKIEAL